MKKCLAILLLAGPAFGLSATNMELKVEIPALQVAEYHAPYVAIWLQNKGTKDITNLALWYDMDMRNNKGEQWLKDIRQWWRRSGRGLTLPVDGVTGATRTAGHYSLSFNGKDSAIANLPAGDYEFNIEAVREVGGREHLTMPFSLPIDKPHTLSIQGDSELGAIAIEMKP